MPTVEAWTVLLDRHVPGDRLPIIYRGRTGERQAVLTLTADPKMEIVANEKIGQPLTAVQRRFRDNWLGSKVPSPS